MVDILKDKVVKTRKEQTCWGCAAKFKVGTDLRSVTVVDGGNFTTSYWCKVCDVTWKERAGMYGDDGVDIGEVREWDNWGKNAILLPRTY